MMNDHNVIHIEYNIRVIIISIIKSYPSFDPDIRVNKAGFISNTLNYPA